MLSNTGFWLSKIGSSSVNVVEMGEWEFSKTMKDFLVGLSSRRRQWPGIFLEGVGII